VDFGKALATVASFLEAHGHRYGVIGGVALTMYGMPRTTVDLDLVVEGAAQDELIRFVESLGYQTLHRSSGYSNHAHTDPSQGKLDFVYIRGETSEQIFAGCRWLKAPGGLEAPVPRPEHLAALKVLAMKNDPSRIFQEMADLRFLIALPGVDRSEIHTYFTRHDLEDRFDELNKAL